MKRQYPSQPHPYPGVTFLPALCSLLLLPITATGSLAQGRLVAMLTAVAIQSQTATQPPAPPTTPTDKPGNAGNPPAPPGPGSIPSPNDLKGLKQTDLRPSLEYSADEGEINQGTGDFHARGDVKIRYGDVTLTADRADGNFNREIVFSGHAKVERKGSVSYADAIHFYPKDRSYRLDNPRSVFQPSALEYRVTDPLFLTSGTLLGARDGYTDADRSIATTCIEEHHHYELRARSAELYPGKKLILRRVGIVFFGVRLIELPTLIIPLDRKLRRFRSDYLPEAGRNINEGYYARFPYVFAVGAAAATFLRLDFTEKLGQGYRVEQEYLAGKQESAFNTRDTSVNGNNGFNPSFNPLDGQGALTSAYGYGNLRPGLPRLGTGLGPQNGGLFAMQGYFNSGFDNNFNASFRHQQSLGSNNRIGLTTEYQRNSYLSFSNQTSQNSRFNFAHNDPSHGVNAELSLGLNTNDSDSFNTNQITGSYRQSFDFASRGSTRNNLIANFDLSRLLTESGDIVNRTARLDSKLTFHHTGREYEYTVDYNKNSPLGPQSGGGSFGTLEKLPELQMSVDTLNFQKGWLRRVPLRMEVGYGLFSEGGGNTVDDRTSLNFNLQEMPLLRGRTTEIVTGGGFEQRLYGDGAAQYVMRNTTRLRQRLGGRSGFDLNYQYQQPEGGTPFFFDTFGRSHNLNAEAGYLDDQHFQFTVRAGYDFLGTSALNPWQSVSLRTMVRPNPRTRFDALAVFDPNSGKFFSLNTNLRLRARNDFALDLYARYDPQQGKWSQLNSQFNIPVGKSWRLAGLLRYNGFKGQLESTNLQVVHTWDCLEASMTYTETPLGFRNDKQLFFMVRITAFPFFRGFARGPAGESLGPGLGDSF